MSSRATVALSFAILFGCTPSIGPCSDDDRRSAHTVVYDGAGRPAYAGQALILGSCAGGGSYCHSEIATERFGAPYDLNFDPLLADDPAFPDEVTGAAHLHAAQVRIFRERDDVWGTIYDRSMPPGEAGAETIVPYVRYADASDTTGTPLPGLETAEGLELVRQWLACGEPLIESTTAIPPRPCTSHRDCAALTLCDFDTSTCVNVGDVAPVR